MSSPPASQAIQKNNGEGWATVAFFSALVVAVCGISTLRWKVVDPFIAEGRIVEWDAWVLDAPDVAAFVRERLPPSDAIPEYKAQSLTHDRQIPGSFGLIKVEMWNSSASLRWIKNIENLPPRALYASHTALAFSIAALAVGLMACRTGSYVATNARDPLCRVCQDDTIRWSVILGYGATSFLFTAAAVFYHLIFPPTVMGMSYFYAYSYVLVCVAAALCAVAMYWMFHALRMTCPLWAQRRCSFLVSVWMCTCLKGLLAVRRIRPKTGLLLLSVSLLLTLLGVLTDQWRVGSDGVRFSLIEGYLENRQHVWYYADGGFRDSSGIRFAASRCLACCLLGAAICAAALHAGTCVARGVAVAHSRAAQMYELVSWAAAFSASLCWLTAVSIYAAHFPHVGDTRYGYSFALVCTAIPVSVLAGLLFCPARKPLGPPRAWV